jgi:hypothetical protein
MNKLEKECADNGVIHPLVRESVNRMIQSHGVRMLLLAEIHRETANHPERQRLALLDAIGSGRKEFNGCENATPDYHRGAEAWGEIQTSAGVRVTRGMESYAIGRID